MWNRKKREVARVLVFELSLQTTQVMLFERRGADCRLLQHQPLSLDILSEQYTDAVEQIRFPLTAISCVRFILPDEVALEESMLRSRGMTFKHQYQILRLKLLDITGVDEGDVSFAAVQDKSSISAFMLRRPLIQGLKNLADGLGVYLDMICVHRQIARDRLSVSELPQQVACLPPTSASIANFIDWRRCKRRVRMSHEFKLFIAAVVLLSALILVARTLLSQHIAQHRQALQHLELQVSEQEHILSRREEVYPQLGKVYNRWRTWQEIQQQKAEYIEGWGLLEQMGKPEITMHEVLLEIGQIQLEAEFSSHQQMTNFVDWLVANQGRQRVQIVSVKKGEAGIVSRLSIRRQREEGEDVK